MRYSNTQIEAVPNFTRPSYNKPKRSTFSEHTVKNNKKLLPKKHHEFFIQQILEEIIENVIIIENKKSTKQVFLISYMEKIFDHIMEIQYCHKQQNFGMIQDEPRSQTNPKTKQDKQQFIFQSQLSCIQPPEVVQVISKRLTFLNRTSNPFKMLPVKVTDQEDDYISQLRQQYLKALEIARIKKLKKNRSTIVNRSSIIAGPKKITTSIASNILTQTKQEDKNKQQDKQYQELKIIDMKVNKPRIASYCQIQQQQIPIIKHQSLHLSSSNNKTQTKNIKRISKNISSSDKKLPIQQLNLEQNKLKHHEKSISEITRIPNDINKQNRSNSKRVTQNDKDFYNVKLLIQSKRSSLPENSLKIFVQNRLKVKQQTNVQIKQFQKQRNKTQHQKGNNTKQNRNKKYNNSKPIDIISNTNSRHVINKTKDYTLQSQHISQNNSTSISSSIRQSLIYPTTNLIKSKFGTGKNPQSKHQIIQLLQALDSPHTVNLQKAYSPIPLRLQKIRKYLNNSNKQKQ